MSATSIHLLTIPEAAKVLRVSKPRLYDLIRQGLVPAARLGRHLRLEENRLREFLDAGGRGLEGGWKGKPLQADSPREATARGRA
jgi:excisionase family DNA binding protein